MQSIIKTIKTYIQVLLVLSAFALMVVLSYVFMSDIEYSHLRKDANRVLTYAQNSVESELLKTETLLNNFSETIRSMIIAGEDLETVKKYMSTMSKHIHKNNQLSSNTARMYGIFDVLGGGVYTDFDLPEHYDLTETSWYKAAVKANGKIIIDEPYFEESLGSVVTAYARRILDLNGNPIGVICLYATFGDILNRYVVNMDITEGGFGLLLNKNLEIVAHPLEEYLGKKAYDTDMPIFVFKEELMLGEEIFERKVRDYRGEESVIFFKTLNNGWHLGAVAPQKKYYHNINKIAVVLSAIAITLTVLLCIFFVRIIKAKNNVEKRMMLMLDTAPLCISFFDKSLKVVDCNKKLLDLFGFKNAKEYEKNFCYCSPEFQPDGSLSKDKAMEWLNRSFEEGYCCFEWVHMIGNGQLMPCEVTAKRVEHKGENCVAVYIHDLREQKAMIRDIEQKSQELKEVNHWYESMLDVIPFLISIQDVKGHWTFINKATENFLGKKREDVIGSHCSNFNISICNTEKCAMKCADRGIKITNFQHNGLSYQSNVELLKDLSGNVTGYIEAIQDITQIEETARSVAENANKAKSVFLARMSHEIRTPMNAILGVTEIELQNDALPSHTREAFVMIYNSGNLLLGIINNILDLSKIEAGKMEIAVIKYELASLINDIVQLNIMRNSKQIEFEVHVDENLPAQLMGDEIRIRQILNNLLSNAFKYTEEGRIKLSVSSEEVASDSKITIVFKVSDTGRGMTEEQASKLFTNEYIRYNLEANRYVEGTGLGMSITRHLLQMMNGQIFVNSILGKGTTFTVHLPQECASSEPLGSDRAEKLMQLRILDTTKTRATQFMREYMPYGKVLIVDDVESNLYVAKGLMAPYGLSIDIVSSGQKAINKIKAGNVYDIIFMDHMMPEMDGIEAAKIIRKMGYAQPIVALTANVLIGQAKLFLENGFDDFVSKPIDIRQLNSVLNRLVRDKQPPEVLEEARRDVTHCNEQETTSKTELLSMFIVDAKNILPILDSTLKNIDNLTDDEWHIFTIKAHAIKSALANIEETELSLSAYALERAGKAHDKMILRQKTQALITSIQTIIDNGEAKIEKKTVDKDPDPAYLRLQMEKISKACENYEIDVANAAITDLKKTTWTKETEDVINKIAMQLLYSDFEDAAALSSSYKAD